MNRAPYDKCEFLICGDNFGCGSSRDYAVWGLLQLGIRAIIAPSIAGIFFGNCDKNGLLAITLPSADVDFFIACAFEPKISEMTIDLEAQTIEAASQIDAFKVSQRNSRKWPWTPG